MPAGDNEELLRRCAAGDEDAWRELVELFAPLILSIPRRYGLKAALAEDVFADVCLALVRSLPKIRDPKALPAWLIRTTTRATWDTARKAKVLLSAEGLPELTGAAPPDEFVNAREEAHLVREALTQVPPRCRELLELLYFKAPAPSYDDIARDLDVPRGSIGPTRRRCLEKLRRSLPPTLAEG